MIPPVFQINRIAIAQRDLSLHMIKTPLACLFIYLFIYLYYTSPFILFFTLCGCWFLLIIYLGGTFSSIRER